jgi:serine/threonine protein kinase
VPVQATLGRVYLQVLAPFPETSKRRACLTFHAPYEKGVYVGTIAASSIAHSQIERVVAIKRLLSQSQFDSRKPERFLKEAQRTSALNHPNVSINQARLRSWKNEQLLVSFSEIRNGCVNTAQAIAHQFPS